MRRDILDISVNPPDNPTNTPYGFEMPGYVWRQLLEIAEDSGIDPLILVKTAIAKFASDESMKVAAKKLRAVGLKPRKPNEANF